MSDLKDFSMEPEEVDGQGSPRPKWPYLLIGAVVVLLLVAVLFFVGDSPEEVEPTPEGVAESVSAERETAELETPPEVELPPLEESDEWMRQVVAQLSTHPALARWLVVDELIRRFTVVVDNVAEGVSPRVHVPFLTPAESFKSHEAGGRFQIDPDSYKRYDNLVAVVESLDVRGTAELYRSVKPLIQTAYEDLGYPGRDFDDTLARAIRRVLETPVVSGEIALRPKVSSYAFEDPELESLSEAQKHLLRLGPSNLRRIKATVRELAVAVGIPSEGLGG